MIYTVTFNPALDYVVHVDHLVTDAVNRSRGEAVFYGGKGINVSTVLHHLGIASKALGFVAGFTGEEIEKGLKEQGIDTDFVHLKKGMSRINVKIRAEEEMEINGQGPDISDEELNELFQKLDGLKEGDILVLAGAVPAGLPSNVYETIMERLSGKGISVTVDATGDLLFNVLKYHPFLIKPNNHELGEMFHVVCNTEDDIRKYAQKLQEQGAENVLVSLAGDGAFLLTKEKKAYLIDAPDGEAVNSVGAGDSMVAGFLAGYLAEQDYEKALRLGTAAGSATAFSEGLAQREEIERLYDSL